MNAQGIYYGKPVETRYFTPEGKPANLSIKANVTHIMEAEAWKDVTPFETNIYLYTSEKAWPWTSKKLKLAKFNGDFGDPKFEGDANGCIQLQCKHEQYNGETKERWDLSLGAPDGGNSKPSEEAVLQMNAKWEAEKLPF